jgi:hypothetical protein
MPEGPIRIRGDLFAMNIDLKDIVLRAKLEPAGGGGYKLTEGITTGKWALATAFPGIASIRYTGGKKLCTDDQNYLTLKATLCGNADLRLDGSQGVCDTLSFGAKFTSDPALLGAVVPPEAPPDNPCAVDKDPSTDMCK